MATLVQRPQLLQIYRERLKPGAERALDENEKEVARTDQLIWRPNSPASSD
jgi:hypothetical protein